jgi:hypothetical protein
METTKTYTAKIYIGTLPGYEGEEYPLTKIEQICQEYCNKVKLGLTITPTKFIYVDGNENGAIIGLINYPRFPSTPPQIRVHAITLAEKLKEQLKQNRVSIVFPDQTIMLGDP